MDTEVKKQSKKKVSKKRIVLISLAVFFGVYILLQILPYRGFSGESNFKIEEGEAPLVISHGGAKHLYPENTVMAFEESFEMGVDVLEMDLCMTEDGVLITHHNLTVDATANAVGEVNSFSLSEINEMNFGYNFTDIDGEMPYRDESDPEILSRLVPMTVTDMFDSFGNEALYIMEIKDGEEIGIAAAEELNRLINEYELWEYVCVASFHSEVMEHFVAIKDDRVDISMDMSAATTFVVANYLGAGIFFEFPHAGLQLPPSMSGIPLDNSYLAYKIHHNNMFLHYWTINDKEEMQRLIELGCDGIITDRPDLMIELLREMGY